MKQILFLARRHGPWFAAGLFLAALATFGAMFDGYAQAEHPVALLGAKGIANADAFNLLGFALPGLIVAMVLWPLREWLPATGSRFARWLGGIGANLVLLSALAFAAQAVFPLDPTDLENATSGRHAATWMVWWIAFTAGGVLLAAVLRQSGATRRLASLTVLAAFAVPVVALLLPQWLPPGWAQRFAFVLWFAWVIAVARVVSRSELSASGS